MTITEISLKSLRKTLGNGFGMDKVENIFFDTGLEIEGLDEASDSLRVEVTSDRSDLLSAYGIVRMLKQYSGESGPEALPKLQSSGIEINVGAQVEGVRPYIAAAVVRDLSLKDEDVRALMQLQEKLHETICGKRRIASIGLYALAAIKFPLEYTAEDPSKIRFRPLGAQRIMSAKEILAEQKTGMRYADILSKHKLHPIFKDAYGKVLSYPPIINSDDLGRVSAGDKSVLIEVTGTNRKRVSQVLNIMVDVFRGLGGSIGSVTINYANSKEVTPDVFQRAIEVKLLEIERILGLHLSQDKVQELLGKMGYASSRSGSAGVLAHVPFYRHDILHAVDIIDDIMRAYGVNEIKSVMPNVFTAGSVSARTRKLDFLRDAVIGLGFDETLTLALTSEEFQYTRMGIKPEHVVRLPTAKSEEMNIVRSSMVPELLRALKNNDRYRLPIRIFEASDVVVRSPHSDTGYSNDTRFAAVICASDAGFTSAKQLLEFVLALFGRKCRLDYSDSGTFIGGRGARVLLDADGKTSDIGAIGELHPSVLENFGIESPAAVVEISLGSLL